MENIIKRRSGIWVFSVSAAVLFICILVVIKLGSISVPRGSCVEVARIPHTVMEVPVGGAVLADRNDILLLGDSPYDKTVLLSVSNGAYRKIFETDSEFGVPLTGFPMRLSITPDNQRILFRFARRNAPAGMIDITKGRLLWETPCPVGLELRQNPFSDDGKYFAAKRYDVGDTQLWLFDSLTGKPVRELARPKAAHPDRSLSPDGSKRIDTRTIKNQSQIIIRETASNGQEKVYHLGKDGDVIEYYWSPDSKYVAVTAKPGKNKILFKRDKRRYWFTFILDAGSGSVVSRLKDSESDVLLFDWYPNSSGVLCMTATKSHLIVHKLSVK